MRTWRFGLYYVVVFGAYVALSLWLPGYYNRVFGLPLAKAALLTASFIFPASLLRPVGRLAVRQVRRAAGHLRRVRRDAARLRSAGGAGRALGFKVGLGGFVALIEVLGIGMGLGKASVYKYIADYFPNEVGAAGGLVGTLGALGGFFLPLGFGYLEKATGRPECCFWVMLALVAVCLVWLHAIVSGMRRRSSIRFDAVSMDSGRSDRRGRIAGALD